MTEHQSELLAFIIREFREYRLIPITDTAHKRDKKQYIHGLMMAARVIGVSYDKLNAIVEAEPVMDLQSHEDELSIPTYIRHQLRRT